MRWRLRAETAKFDLTLELTEGGEGVEGVWQYSTDLFDAETIERLSGHFQTLLEAMVREPEQAVSELELLSAAEREQLLVEWNQTAREYPSRAEHPGVVRRAGRSGRRRPWRSSMKSNS